MKTFSLMMCALAAASCGGKAKGPQEPPPDPPIATEDDEVEPTEDPPVDEPPPLQQWFARAALTPVKGVALESATVRFSQVEGAGVDVIADAFEGLKPGRYHLAIHSSGECGKNATKAGPVWTEAAGVVIGLEVTKQDPGGVEENGADLSLDGERTVVGRTLVLHADKKGQPGKVLACGSIVADGD